jgi:hypothetical protein
MRGDIVLALFPDSNLRTSKLRPALVVQANNLQTGLKQMVVAMIQAILRARTTEPEFRSVAKAGKRLDYCMIQL